MKYRRIGSGNGELHHPAEISVVFFHSLLNSGQWVPDSTGEMGIEPGLWVGGFADVYQGAPAIFCTGVIEVVVPIARLPARDHSLNVTTSLIDPSVDFVR